MSEALADPLVLRAPFAVRFADAATGAPFADPGLRVRLFAAGRRVTAAANRRGIHVAHRLPGATGAARVAVSDPRRCVLPFSFSANLPTVGGYALPACVAGPLLPLFPASDREPPAALAAVRLAVRHAADEAPAAFAVLEFSLGLERIGRAIADADGQALALFPWPEPGPGGLTAQRWTLRLRARWDAGLATAAPRAPDDGALLPDYCAVLGQPVVALRDAAAAAVTECEIGFGAVLTLPPLFVDP